MEGTVVTQYEGNVGPGWWLCGAGLAGLMIYGQVNGGRPIQFGGPNTAPATAPIQRAAPKQRLVPPPSKPVRVIPIDRVPDSELPRIRAMMDQLKAGWAMPDGPDAYRFANGPNRGIVRLPQ